MLVSLFSMVAPSDLLINITLSGLVLLLVLMYLITYNNVNFRRFHRRFSIFLPPFITLFLIIIVSKIISFLFENIRKYYQ